MLLERRKEYANKEYANPVDLMSSYVTLVDFFRVSGNEELLLENLNKINGNAMIFASYGTRSSSNNLETYKYLENLGIEPNITTNKGVTPLHSIAYKFKDLDIFNYFISKGFDIKSRDPKGNNIFNYAVKSGNISFLKLLLKKGISPNIINKLIAIKVAPK